MSSKLFFFILYSLTISSKVYAPAYSNRLRLFFINVLSSYYQSLMHTRMCVRPRHAWLCTKVQKSGGNWLESVISGFSPLSSFVESRKKAALYKERSCHVRGRFLELRCLNRESRFMREVTLLWLLYLVSVMNELIGNLYQRFSFENLFWKFYQY